MTDDITNDPEFIAWRDRVKEEVLPKLKDSSFTISIMPNGDPDIKYAVELGLSIMLDKPIIVAISPGATVPAKLVKVADEIVEVDMSNSRTRILAASRVREAIDRIMERRDS
jgi:hypothetical protein